MVRLRLATVWLSGCSGCHMSLLNLHTGLLDLLERADLVYSPLMDIKEFPGGVDVTLVEGAVGTEENREMALRVRRESALVVGLGDCACFGNVTALRNTVGRDVTLQAAGLPASQESEAPPLEPLVLPLHRVVSVDLHLPGCPPEPEQIHKALQKLLNPA